MSENQSHARVASSPSSSAMMRLSLSPRDLADGADPRSNQDSATNVLEVDESTEATVKQRLAEALQRPENACCADCNAPSPKWAAVAHGGFICTQCAGVHRSLGVHVSFVLSCTLDKWTDAQVKLIETKGNDALNETLEYCVPDAYPKPHAETARGERERYIRAKYEDELFRASLGKTRKQAVQSSSSSYCSSANSPVRDTGGGNPAKGAAPTGDRKKSTLLSLAGGLVGTTRRSLPGLFSPTSSSGGGAPAMVSPTPATAAAAGMVEYVGVLVIELLEGMELAGMDINDKSDPYVIFRLGEQTISSKRVHNDVNPRWNETLMLSWDGSSPLVAEIYDYNTISSDRPMGSVVVDAETLAPLLQASPSEAGGEQQRQQAKDEIDAVYPVLMPRIWARNFGEHMVAGAEGMTKGLYRGITGVWKDPIKGAKENGLEGFAKGVGIGVAGVVYRPIKGLGTMVKETARSVGVGRKRSVDGGIEEELMNAGCLHLKLRLQRF